MLKRQAKLEQVFADSIIVSMGAAGNDTTLRDVTSAIGIVIVAPPVVTILDNGDMKFVVGQKSRRKF